MNSVCSVANTPRPPTNAAKATRRRRSPVVERPADDALVAVGHALEPVVEPSSGRCHQLRLPVALDVRVVPARRQHRVERERHEQRHQDGEGHRQAELEEEAADDALHERHRHEHRDDRHRGGEHGQADLARALAGRRRSGPRPCSRCRTMFSRTTIASSMSSPIASESAISVSMFSVMPEEIHDDERRDDRDGQRQARDDRRAPGVQEAGRR